MRVTVAPQKEPSPLERLFLGDPETFRTAIPGQRFGVDVSVVARGNSSVTLDRLAVTFYGQHTSLPSQVPQPRPLADNQPLQEKFTVTVPENAKFTRPYFSRPDIEQSYYDIQDEQYINRPLAPYPLAAMAEFRYRDAPIQLSQYVQTVHIVTGEGTVYEPLNVAPAIGVTITPRAGIVPLDEKSFPLTAVIHSNVKGPAKGRRASGFAGGLER